MVLVTGGQSSLFALTGGPSSPEFASFEPVATTDMVDPFSGGLTYNLPVVNIPGPEGGGYAMSLSYHQGTSAEEEASWVGYGWTLNPGAINRGKNGYPDEFKDKEIYEYSRQRPNWTFTSTLSGTLEIRAKSENDKKKKEERDEEEKKQDDARDKHNQAHPDDQYSKNELVGEGTDKDGKPIDVPIQNPKSVDAKHKSLKLSATKTISFNNYSGFSRASSFSAGTALGSVGVTSTSTGITFDVNVNFDQIFEKQKKKLEKLKDGVEEKITGWKKTENHQSWYEKNLKAGRSNSMNVGNTINFYKNAVPLSVSEYTGRTFQLNFGLGGAIKNIGIEGSTQASMTMQWSKEVNKPRTVTGYFFTKNLKDNDDRKGDYTVERETSFSKRDYLLGIPFASYDNFSVSGEGVGGSFRGHKQSLGVYTPNKVASNATNAKVGLEGKIGPVDVAIGLDLGFGYSRSEMVPWGTKGNDGFNDDDYFFRAANDAGSDIVYTNHGEWKRPDIEFGTYQPLMSEPSLIGDPKSERSNYYEHIIEDDPSSKLFGKLVGFTDVNASGVTYNYKKPLMVQDEFSMNVEVKLDDPVDNNYLMHFNQGASFDFPYSNDVDVSTTDRGFQGTFSPEPYANTFLLSDIRNVNYVDVDPDVNPGPSEDDFGGWTKFTYHDEYSGNKLYRYRIPYNGFIYNPGSISSKKDDVASVSSGQKEVSYLSTIETKSHVAFFVTNGANQTYFEGSSPYFNGLDAEQKTTLLEYVTGGTDIRQDAFGAKALSISPDQSIATDLHAKKGEIVDESDDALKYLQKIVVYSKSDLSKPLQTTYFDYDYSLCVGAPNTVGGEKGKLTLKKVWFTSDGVSQAVISPYEFDYEYVSSSAGNGANSFYDLIEDEAYKENDLGHIIDFFDEKINTAQNPDYNPYGLDCWGNYQLEGQKRKDELKQWLNQQDNPQFDPAPWTLKKVKMPSGGEIWIQYEQHDYRYVQDQQATVLLSLSDITDGSSSSLPTDKYDKESTGRYYLNTNDIDLDPTDALECEAYVQIINNYIKKNASKLSYHFLYALKGGQEAALNDCRSEYIDGYANPTAHYDPSKGIYLTIEEKTPRDVCYAWYNANRDGLLEGVDCEAKYRLAKEINDEMWQADDDKKGNSVVGFASFIKKATALNSDATWSLPKKDDIGKNVNKALSYFRVPAYKAKKGGGSRVKRVLMYDKGIEEGDAHLFGTEYFYEDASGLSSGVASNEPMANRKEHSLVQLLHRGQRSKIEQLFAGKDTKEMEGPIGESLLPGARIGYSRVVSQNVHTGSTGTGYKINEFYTYKDFPNTGSFTDLHDKDYNKKLGMKKPMNLTKYLSFKFYKRWMVQGYEFKLYQMNGKPKKEMSFAGDYLGGGAIQQAIANGEQVETTEISSTSYEYYEPGVEQIKILGYNDTDKKLTLSSRIPGIQEEFTSESRRARENSLNLGIEMDFVISWGIFSIDPNIANIKMTYNNTAFSSFVTNRVIEYPSFVKKVTNTVDGITTTTENLVFDGATGQALVTKVSDGYNNLFLGQAVSTEEQKHNGEFYSYNIPARFIYPELGKKAKDPSYTNQLGASVVSVSTYGEDGNWFVNEDGTPSNEADISATKNFSGVLNASVSKYAQNWYADDVTNIDAVKSEYGVVNDNLTELNKNWYPQATYVYRAESVKNTGGLYDRGVMNNFNFYDGSVHIFEFLKGTSDSKAEGLNNRGNWLMSSQVLTYSPHGTPLQERNVIGINSCAKYDYNNKMLPSIMAVNADYTAIYFDSYELDESESVNRTEVSHSGVGAFDLAASNDKIIINGANASIKVTQNLLDKGARLRLWVHAGEEELDGSLPIFVKVNNLNQVPMQLVTKIGSWYLLSADLTDKEGLQGATLGEEIDIKLINNLVSGQNLWIDDVRFEPLDAQSTCYVYDTKSLRLLAQFDDQHFGSFYQYNAQGQLVRQKVETERGMKTIKETHYHTPLTKK